MPETPTGTNPLSPERLASLGVRLDDLNRTAATLRVTGERFIDANKDYVDARKRAVRAQLRWQIAIGSVTGDWIAPLYDMGFGCPSCRDGSGEDRENARQQILRTGISFGVFAPLLGMKADRLANILAGKSPLPVGFFAAVTDVCSEFADPIGLTPAQAARDAQTLVPVPRIGRVDVPTAPDAPSDAPLVQEPPAPVNETGPIVPEDTPPAPDEVPVETAAPIAITADPEEDSLFASPDDVAQLKQRLSASGISQRCFGEQIGVSTSYASYLLSGKFPLRRADYETGERMLQEKEALAQAKPELPPAAPKFMPPPGPVGSIEITPGVFAPSTSPLFYLSPARSALIIAEIAGGVKLFQPNRFRLWRDRSDKKLFFALGCDASRPNSEAVATLERSNGRYVVRPTVAWETEVKCG